MTKPFDELLVEGLIFMFLVCAGWKVLEWLYGFYHEWRYGYEPPPEPPMPWDRPEIHAEVMRKLERDLRLKREREDKAKQPPPGNTDVLRRTTKEFSEQFQAQQLVIAQAERLERVRENQRINSDIAKIERLEAKLAIEQAELDRAARATRPEK